MTFDYKAVSLALPQLRAVASLLSMVALANQPGRPSLKMDSKRVGLH